MFDFLQIVWSVVLIVIFFGGSIFVHELGHYLAARRRGLKVERFAIGFGPKIWSTMRDGVEWCVCLFPLGGYVALPQLAHLEGLEGEYEKEEQPLKPISYTDTLVVAVMGVVFNMIFAFALGCLLWVVGKPSTASEQTTTIGAVLPTMTLGEDETVPGPAFSAGLLEGDKILSIDGEHVRNWKDIKQFIVTGVGRDTDRKPLISIEIERNGATQLIKASPLLYGPENLRSLAILPAEELYVGQVFKNSPAQKAGVERGDQIIAINGEEISTYYEFSNLVGQDAGAPLELQLKRGEELISYTIAPQEVIVNKEGEQKAMLGFGLAPKIITIHQDPITQIVDAAALAWRTLSSLVNPNSDIGINHLSGPPGIAWIIHRLSYDIRQVISFILIINVNLAILNMLPLPVLDGGQIVIATINRLRRKPISVNLIATMQNIFTIFLLGVMVYVIFFADIPRVKRDWDQERMTLKAAEEMIEPIFK